MSQRSLGSHEDFERHETVQSSSNRSFGIVFCVFFAILAAIQIYIDHLIAAAVLVGLSTLFLIVAFLIPKLLAPLNFAWTKFGLLLHMIINPIVLGAMFFGICTPMGFLMRTFGSDPLQRHMEPDADTYWITREDPGPPPETMTNQF